MSSYQSPEQKEEIQYLILHYYLEKGLSTQGIAKKINAEFGIGMTREQVYPIFRKAAKEGTLLIVPPRHHALGKKLAASFVNQGDLRVVSAHGSQAARTVPEEGADLVLQLVKDLGRKRPGTTVHLGLGVGSSTMFFARRLGKLMRQDSEVPPICIHALSTAYSFDTPLANPESFFSYFTENFHGNVEWVGLYCEPILPHDRYDDVIDSHKIVKQAFESSRHIDIVVSSLASASDEHGYLYHYKDEFDDIESVDDLRERGWKGDVQLRPYSESGPLDLDHGMRPVTLFELEGLRELSKQEDKHVVLLCSPCGSCKMLKTEAMLPLLSQPDLHIWNHLVIDADTAAELVVPGGSSPPAGTP